MNKKYYNCFSTNQMNFLESHMIQPHKTLIHDVTGKTIWIYVRNEKLNELLDKWSNGKAKFLQPTA